jgi:hypothetical protein
MSSFVRHCVMVRAVTACQPSGLRRKAAGRQWPRENGAQQKPGLCAVFLNTHDGSTESQNVLLLSLSYAQYRPLKNIWHLDPRTLGSYHANDWGVLRNPGELGRHVCIQEIEVFMSFSHSRLISEQTHQDDSRSRPVRIQIDLIRLVIQTAPPCRQ